MYQGNLGAARGGNGSKSLALSIIIGVVFGSGIKFLPDDPNDLEKRLVVLISDLELGHTNVDSNGFRAICEQLLKHGRITTGNYKYFLQKYF